MGKDRPHRGAQQTKIDQFAAPNAATRSESNQLKDGGDLGEPQGPTGAQILEAIEKLSAKMQTKIGEVTQEVNLLRNDLKKVSERTISTEQDVTRLKEEVASLKTTISDLVDRTTRQETRAEDAEGRARRCNLRFVGFPEGTEGTRPEIFLETWIKEKLPTAVLSPFFVIERAHRALVRKPPVGAPPRTIITKILNYRDRDAILQAVRLNGDPKHENQVIRIFPDYTQQVQQLRQSFLAVKQKLRAMKIKYMLLYPANLKVIYNEKTFFFETPEEVWDWLEIRGSDRILPPTQGRRWNRPRRRGRPGPAGTRADGNGGTFEPTDRVVVCRDGTLGVAERPTEHREACALVAAATTNGSGGLSPMLVEETPEQNAT